MNEPKLFVSPLSQVLTADGIAVSVEIYRIEGADGWALELVDEQGNATVWEDLFPTDLAAWEEFETGVHEIGLRALLEADGDEPETLH